jgi:hypothetical protein
MMYSLGMKTHNIFFLAINGLVLLSYFLFLNEYVPGSVILIACLAIEAIRFITHWRRSTAIA